MMLIVTIAFLAGVLIGLTGTGAGVILTPLVMLTTPFPAAVVIGTDLLSGAVTKLVGVVEHRKLGQVHWKLAGWLLGGSVPGTLAGILFLHFFELRMPAHQVDRFLRVLLGVTLFAVSVALPYLRRREFMTRAIEGGAISDSTKGKLAAVGAVAGFLVALTSVGSGSLLMIALLALVSLPLGSLVGTDILCGLVITALAGSFHFAMGHVDPRLFLLLAAGEVPGVILGSRLTRRLPERTLTWVFSALYFSLGARLLVG